MRKIGRRALSVNKGCGKLDLYGHTTFLLSCYRFPPEIISYAVWLYHRFCLSFRDVEELLAERGVTISYETVRQWCRKLVKSL